MIYDHEAVQKAYPEAALIADEKGVYNKDGAEIEIEQTISFWQSLRSIIGVDILSVSVTGLNLFFMNRNLYLVSDLITVCIFK